jgi:hypothetical protein
MNKNTDINKGTIISLDDFINELKDINVSTIEIENNTYLSIYVKGKIKYHNKDKSLKTGGPILTFYNKNTSIVLINTGIKTINHIRSNAYFIVLSSGIKITITTVPKD